MCGGMDRAEESPRLATALAAGVDALRGPAAWCVIHDSASRNSLEELALAVFGAMLPIAYPNLPVAIDVVEIERLLER